MGKRGLGVAKQTQHRRAIAFGEVAMTVLPPDAPSQVSISGIKGFTMTVNGLVVDGEPPLEQFRKVGVALRIQEKGSTLALMDFIVEVERRFGEAAAQILDFSDGWSERTVAVYRWVAERISPERRRMDRLGIRHHLLVAPLSPAKQIEWLNAAANDEEADPWTVSRLAAALKEGEDMPPSSLWLLVQCDDIAMQNLLQSEMEQRGRSCKALSRRGKKAK